MDIDKSKLKNLFYTGLTRAKTAAVVIRNEKVAI
jgi:ATP-dependent exoDNAse (exonuclease V) alpha subunit